MSNDANEVIRCGLKAILSETFEGPSSSSSWFVDSDVDGSMLGLLGTLSAAQASRAAPGRKSAAAHAGHARVHLEAVERFMRGDQSKTDWDASWRHGQVDDAGWRRMQGELRAACQALAAAIDRRTEWSDQTLAAAVGAIAHAAYHLGAVRQIVRNLNAPS